MEQREWENNLEGSEGDCGREAVGGAAAAADLLSVLLGHLGRQLLLLRPCLHTRRKPSATGQMLKLWESHLTHMPLRSKMPMHKPPSLTAAACVQLVPSCLSLAQICQLYKNRFDPFRRSIILARKTSTEQR